LFQTEVSLESPEKAWFREVIRLLSKGWKDRWFSHNCHKTKIWTDKRLLFFEVRKKWVAIF